MIFELNEADRLCAMKQRRLDKVTTSAQAEGIRNITGVHCHTRLTILSHVHFEGADEWLRLAEIRLRRVMS